MKRIEEQTARQIHTVLTLCRSKGLDPVQVLDEGRLLRHMGTRREDAIRVLENAINVVNSAPGSRIAEIKTPLDMKNVIIEKLREIRDGIAAEI